MVDSFAMEREREMKSRWMMCDGEERKKLDVGLLAKPWLIGWKLTTINEESLIERLVSSGICDINTDTKFQIQICNPSTG